jgi:hypothetical protein
MIQSEEINKTIGLSKWHPYNVSTSMDPEGYRSTDTLYGPSLRVWYEIWHVMICLSYTPL